jgi:hypothetical protein
MLKLHYFKYPNTIKIILAIYIIGFGIGTTTHSISLFEGGFLPYTNVPLWKNIYWTSLTFLDLFAIFLVLKSLTPALLVSNLIIISDVIINTNGFQYFDDYRIWSQIALGLYILITTPIIILKYKKLKIKSNNQN